MLHIHGQVCSCTLSSGAKLENEYDSNSGAIDHAEGG